MCTFAVTSYAEVWIEINNISPLAMLIQSPPTRRCGLKSLLKDLIRRKNYVTSYAEVWIEILTWNSQGLGRTVTSYAEVWIEMNPRGSMELHCPVTSYAEVWIEIMEL